MSILKYKYKAHKFINYAFYAVVFIVGFLLGFSTNKIDFNKLMSQLLMIDNVSATTTVSSITTTVNYSSLGITNSNYYKEDKIYNVFNAVNNDFSLNLDFSEYSNVFIYGFTSGSNIEYYFTNSEFSYYKSGTYHYLNLLENSSYLHITIYTNSGNLKYELRANYNNSYLIGFNNTVSKHYSTQDLGLNNFQGLLDFSDYVKVDLEFNENLFKDNPDFKQVCVNNYDTFSITSNQIQDYDDNNNPVFHDFDFIWFPNGLAYLSAFQYDSESSTHINFYDDIENSFVGWGYWLDTKEEIDKHFSSDNPGIHLAFKGYEDKYSYFNWTFYPFEMTFTTDYHFYTIFSFNNSYLKQAGISTVVDNAYIKYLDGTIKEDSEQYCFYIKNQYDVNILNRNQNGDFNSTITVLGGINKDDVTYELEMGRNYNGFFSTINNFISKIRPTVIFINTHILELYTSMPLIVRMFVISFLTLIVVRILIGMVVK